ncbi:MAG: tetratricopeptide repeat protein [Actinobacteria bacterium]|nr:tetratricopeptide repeat protein [Actinomycetota bacterium]
MVASAEDLTLEAVRTLAAVHGAGRQVLVVSKQPLEEPATDWLPDGCFVVANQAGPASGEDDVGSSAHAEENSRRDSGESGGTTDAGEVTARQALAAADAGDYDSAKRLFEEAAAMGNSRAMVNRGLIAKAEGDPDLAYRWFKQAVALDDDDGATEAADLLSGEDTATALELLQIASDRGHPQATFLLGFLTEQQGNSAAATELYERAAELGSGNALSALALRAKESGDPAKAQSLYRRAAEGGDAFSMAMIGMESFHSDPDLAKTWFERSLQAGWAQASAVLATLDEAHADEWIAKGARVKGTPKLIR